MVSTMLIGFIALAISQNHLKFLIVEPTIVLLQLCWLILLLKVVLWKRCSLMRHPQMSLVHKRLVDLIGRAALVSYIALSIIDIVCSIGTLKLLHLLRGHAHRIEVLNLLALTHTIRILASLVKWMMANWRTEQLRIIGRDNWKTRRSRT